MRNVSNLFSLSRLSATTPIGPPKTSIRKSYQPSQSSLCSFCKLLLYACTFLFAATVSIPPGMVQDQFGMMGLLTFIRGAETDPNLVALALGRYMFIHVVTLNCVCHVCIYLLYSDLTTLGLNLNSPG